MKYVDLIDELNGVLDRNEVSFTEEKLSLYKLKEIITEDLKQYTYVEDALDIVNDINKDRFTTSLFGLQKRIDTPKVKFNWCSQRKYSDHSDIVFSHYKHKRKSYFIKISGDMFGEYDKFEITSATFFGKVATGKKVERIHDFFDRYISVRKDEFSNILTNITKLQKMYDCNVFNDILEWGKDFTLKRNVSPSVEYVFSLENTSGPNTCLRFDRNLEFEDFTNKQSALKADKIIIDHEDDIYKRTPIVIDTLPEVYKNKIFKK